MRFNQSRGNRFLRDKRKGKFLTELKSSSSPHSVVTPNIDDFMKTFFYNFSLRLHFPSYHLVCHCRQLTGKSNKIEQKGEKFFCVLSNAPGNFARVKKVDKRTDKIIFMWFPWGTEDRKVIENICLSHTKIFLFFSTIGFLFFYHVFIGKCGEKLVSDSRVLLILHFFPALAYLWGLRLKKNKICVKSSPSFWGLYFLSPLLFHDRILFYFFVCFKLNSTRFGKSLFLRYINQ